MTEKLQSANLLLRKASLSKLQVVELQSHLKVHAGEIYLRNCNCKRK
jgi:hypothetical protein